MLDPSKMATEEATSYPDFEGRKVGFFSNQFNISNDGQKIITICQDEDYHVVSSTALLEFKIADNEITIY